MSCKVISDTIDHSEIVAYIDTIIRSESIPKLSPEFTFLILIECCVRSKCDFGFRRRNTIDCDGVSCKEVGQGYEESRS